MKTYEQPQMIIELFETGADIITSSPQGEDGGDIFED